MMPIPSLFRHEHEVAIDNYQSTMEPYPRTVQEIVLKRIVRWNRSFMFRA